MVLLAQRESDRLITTIGPPPTPAPPIPTDYGNKDWGLSIGICALVGMKVWELIKRYHKDDSDLNKELVRALIAERQMLIKATLDKKP
jgi:hypothetical protein